MNVQIKAKLVFSLSLLLCAEGTFAASIFTPDSQPTGWLAQPSMSSYDLQSGTENFYQLDYSPDTWSGDLLAFKINAYAVVQPTGPWDSNDPTTTSAADLLDLNVTRKIVTRANGTGVGFSWGNLTTAQQTSISSVAATGVKIVDYVRGGTSNEVPIGVFRPRDHVLGDILHSTIQYWNHNASTKRIYVGANDGMLHVFDASTGQEVFAYIPSMLIPKLNKLVISNPYIHSHFVDGPIGISNVDFGGTVKTLLVGGLGAGGKGLYSLDVTDPSPTSENDAATKIKWEVTPATTGYADLGYTFGTPRIARLNDTNATAVAVVGNGYVNGGSGHAVLYLINIDTGALIKAIDTGSGTTTSPNGLSTPTLVETTGDDKVDYAYAGDIDGHVWKFDLTGSDPSLYGVVDKDTATAGIQPLFTTSPVQPITTAPAITAHPNGGQMLAFATGRILDSGDIGDASVHYVYGIWDGAPAANNQLLSQTLTPSTYTLNSVVSTIRTITSNVPDWTAGTGKHYGWKVALPAGERVVGEIPFYTDGRFYFLSTNPNTLAQAPDNGKNWLNEFTFINGGSPLSPIFDLNKDSAFNSSDLASSCTPNIANHITCIPVSKYLTGGVFSQPIYVTGLNYSTTLFAFHPDLPTANTTTTTTGGGGGGTVVDPPDPGVSGGHFDFDIYYGSTTNVTTKVPTALSQTKSICEKTSNVVADLGKVSSKYCKAGLGTPAPGFSTGYSFLTNLSSTSTACSGASGKTTQILTCNTYNTLIGTVGNNYANQKHVHEYDDIYDVTGVNMLNASEPQFNLSPNIIASATDTTNEFKVLVMNQYLNPAAKLSISGSPYESVKTFKGLASQTDATTLINSLQPIKRKDIGTLIFNLPLDAFKSKDWWGDGGAVRAGLIPVNYTCVVYLNPDGSMFNSGNNGLIGPNGERFDGALAFQIIKSTTPASALEFNHNGNGGLTNAQRAKYGWRVKQSLYNQYVIGEYTTYWHHPNNICYGKPGWIADAPEDLISDAKAKPRAADSKDPEDGLFSGGGGIISTATTVSGNATTTVTTYVGGAKYTRTDLNNGNGTTTVTQTFTDGSTVVTTINNGSSTGTGTGTGTTPTTPTTSTTAGCVDAGGGCSGGNTSPYSPLDTEKAGRLSWREWFQ
jgi:type IV pilus assembly protein PilY1